MTSLPHPPAALRSCLRHVSFSFIALLLLFCASWSFSLTFYLSLFLWLSPLNLCFLLFHASPHLSASAGLPQSLSLSLPRRVSLQLSLFRSLCLPPPLLWRFLCLGLPDSFSLFLWAPVSLAIPASGPLPRCLFSSLSHPLSVCLSVSLCPTAPLSSSCFPSP